MLYQKENVHGGDVYGQKVVLDYSVNTNPLGPPDAVKQAVRDAAGDIGCYPDPYCRELIKAIADAEQVPAEMVICGNGAAELIYAFCHTLRPKKAALTAPSFAEYELALNTVSCEICRYRPDQSRGFVLDEGFPAFLEKERPEVLFLCNPNNPDGREIPEELLHRIVHTAGELGTRILLDECFCDLSDHRISGKPFLASYQNLFLVKAFTKNFAMAGLRLGYGLCSDSKFLAALAETVQPWNVSVPAQAAGIAALRHPEVIQKAREIIPAQRAWLSGQLQKLGFRVIPSEANYILFYGPEGMDSVLRNRQILIRSCASYQGLGAGWYRIAVKKETENRQFIAALRECINEKSTGRKDQK